MKTVLNLQPIREKKSDDSDQSQIVLFEIKMHYKQKERHKVSYMKTYICIDDVRLAIPGLEGVSVPLDLFNTSSATIPDDLEDLDMDRYILIHFNSQICLKLTGCLYVTLSNHCAVPFREGL